MPDSGSNRLSADGLEILEEWTHKLSNAETEEELFRAVTEIVLDDLPLSEATIYCFDRETASLRPEATSTVTAGAVLPGNDPVWEAFRNRTTTVFEKAETDRSSDETNDHLFAVPVGEEGILVAEGADRLDHDSREIRAAQHLCSIAGSELGRIQCKKQLGERDRELERQTRTLERIERRAEAYRVVSQVAISADTREGMEQEICDQLIEDDAIQFVWFGELNRANGRISPRSWGGSEQGYLERTPFELDDEGEPAVRAARRKEVCVVDNLASESVDERWRSEALERGFRSIMAIPLSHNGILHGIVTVYGGRPNAFEGATELARDTGDLIGHTITTLQCRDGLLAHTSTELDVEITAPACFFVRFARETETNVSLEAMSPKEDGSILVFVRAEEPELFLEYAERTVTVSSIQRLDDDTNGEVIQARFDDSFIGSYLSIHRMVLESASATPNEAQITVSIPPGMTPRRALEIINAEYPNSTLIAKREGRERNNGSITSRTDLLERLTDRQRKAVERAYRNGYFEIPKDVTGKNVAASMDISTSAFHNHLRAAESELFSWLFDNETD